MKKLLFVIFAFFLSFTITSVVDAQLVSHHDAHVYWYGRDWSTDPVQFQYSVLTNYPPLSTGMPFDVLIGYIYLDSIVRTVPPHSVDSFYKQLGYSDTLRRVVKYIYEMEDFDPIKFSQYIDAHLVGYKTQVPIGIIQRIFKSIKKNYPDSLKTTQLLYSADYILDVRADWVATTYDSARPVFHNSTSVECSVLDTIKGRRWPACIFDSTIAYHGKIQPLSAPSCIEFDYLPDWSRNEHVDALPTDSGLTLNGHTWIERDSEYIVFLQLYDLGRDSTYNYSAISPLRTANTMAGMYPVRGGRVYDPNNDFGFGTGLTVTEFKNKLRSRIYSITHP